MNNHKLNSIGILFRFITPALLVILGTFLMTIMNDVKGDVNNLEDCFKNHLEHHRVLEITLAEKLTKIETILNTLKEKNANLF